MAIAARGICHRRTRRLEALYRASENIGLFLSYNDFRAACHIGLVATSEDVALDVDALDFLGTCGLRGCFRCDKGDVLAYLGTDVHRRIAINLRRITASKDIANDADGTGFMHRQGYIAFTEANGRTGIIPW